MLKHLDSMILKSKLLDSQDYSLNSSNSLSKYNFKELKKYFLSKEIEFDNVSTKEKKENNENITSINFNVTNLINILDKKDKISNCITVKDYKNKNSKQNDLHKNLKLKAYEKLNFETENNLKKNGSNKKFLVYSIIEKPKTVKQEVKNKLNRQKNIDFKNNFFFKRNNFLNTKYYSDLNKKNIAFFKNFKNNKSDFIFFRNMHKKNFITNCKKNISDNNKKYFQFDADALKILFLKKDDEWKTAIKYHILLSMSNKENKAEIFFKPEYFGSVHIKIKMKKDKATLNFISNHNEIKVFLKNCIPFLRTALIQNGIQLKKVNVYNSFLENEMVTKKKEYFVKNYFLDKNKFERTSYFKEYYSNLIQNREIDMYV